MILSGRAARLQTFGAILRIRAEVLSALFA